MVPTVVVVCAAARLITLVPSVSNLLQGLWSAFIHAPNHVLVHLFAVTHPTGFNLKRLVEKVVFAGNNIYEVADAAGSVFATVEVDVDATPVVGKTSSLPQPADELL